MKTLGTIIAFFFTLLVYPQDQKVFFHNAIASRILKYNIKLDQAIGQRDYERAEFLFDSLFSNHLKNTYVENLELKKVNGGIFQTEKLKVPFVLITKSTSFQQNYDEIDLINEVSRRYKNQIKIIVLYYGNRKEASHAGKDFNNFVTITYSNERENENDFFVATYKHSFGVPACFFVSDKKQITYIDRAFTMVSKNLDINSVESTNKQLALLLFKEENIHEGIITDNPEFDKSDY